MLWKWSLFIHLQSFYFCLWFDDDDDDLFDFPTELLNAFIILGLGDSDFLPVVSGNMSMLTLQVLHCPQ